jgi:hypothetical protein
MWPLPRELLWALIFSLATFVVVLWPSQYPYKERPQVQAEQPSDSVLQRGEDTGASVGPAATAHKENGGKSAEQRESEGTEFWPTFLGLKIKITDSLLAIFTLGLLIFTGLLWHSTDKLWTAGERQLEVTRAALVGDQRAWITTSLLIDRGGMTFRNNEVGIDVSLQVSNVGRTSALRCLTNMKIVADFSGLPDKVKKICEECKIRDAYNGRLAAPNETYARPWRLSATDAEIYPYGRKAGVFPIVIGCVTYEILQDDLIHQTAFAYSLALNDGNALGGSIRREDGDLTADRILVLAAPGGFTS